MTESSGNVFADLGVKNPEEHLAKAVIARQICSIIETQKLSKIAVRARLGIEPERTSQIIRGQLSSFSKEELQELFDKIAVNG